MGFLRRDDASSCSDESGGEIFKSIPKNSTAFCIWKIEGLRTISLGRTKVGNFISDSAYLIYAASARDGPLPYPGMPTKELKESDAIRAIHLWVGSDCDATVSAGAALRAAELDSQLPEPGATLLLREAQGREGPRFLAYFRQRHLAVLLGPGVDYINSNDIPKITSDKANNGSHAHDINSNDNNKVGTLAAGEARLHRVSGTGLPVLTELGTPDWSLFSSRHVILLHVPHRSTMFLWLGANSEPLHKSHAVRLIDEYKNKDNDEMRVFVVEDGYEKTLKPEARKLFDEILDPTKRFVAPEPLITVDSSSKSAPTTTDGVRLYKCSEQGGKYKVAELKSGAVWRSELESEWVYLLDRGELAGGVWAWVGSAVPGRERLEALRNARGFVKKRGYGPNCPVGRALEGREPPELRAWIRGCRKSSASSSRGAIGNGGSALQQIILPVSFEPSYMSERPKLAAECQLVDDGSAERQLWLMVKSGSGGHKLEPLPKDQSVLYAEACYVLSYKYGYGRTARTIVYCWEGVQSHCADREATLEAACLIAEEESAQLVRTSQGNEPAHFLQIFKGKLAILAGPHRNSPPRKYLVRVYGSTPHTSKAVERPLRANSLDARGVFILFSGSSAIVWCGSRSTGDAREASRRLAPPCAPLVPQGHEDDEFWAQLGGQDVCDTENKELQEEGEETDTHLYHLKVEKDAFVGEEILGFSQSNLLPEAAWLLDTGNLVWVWVGNLIPRKALKEYVREAKIFLYTHPASRDRNTIISIIRQGTEPPTFIGRFDNWNYNLLRDYKNTIIMKDSNQEQDQLINDIMSNKMVSNFDSFVKYPQKILRSDPEQLPPGIDPLHKEMHLTYDDFMTIFKMKPAEFEKLPIWRRQRLKQNAGLF
ncbi:hypothetical protein QAD02_001809 [Eretmocerus hayati]|uniref:Uncharacterized protein n=1 Tax=Eretmocerus hayati TaxID=131215 RepID=A0ACC2NHC5_9HYME|nr:hypothetical protein QAD02_001809 [Eretmocerus hayati]